MAESSRPLLSAYSRGEIWWDIAGFSLLLPLLCLHSLALSVYLMIWWKKRNDFFQGFSPVDLVYWLYCVVLTCVSVLETFKDLWLLLFLGRCWISANFFCLKTIQVNFGFIWSVLISLFALTDITLNSAACVTVKFWVVLFKVIRLLLPFRWLQGTLKVMLLKNRAGRWIIFSY